MRRGARACGRPGQAPQDVHGSPPSDPRPRPPAQGWQPHQQAEAYARRRVCLCRTSMPAPRLSPITPGMGGGNAAFGPSSASTRNALLAVWGSSDLSAACGDNAGASRSALRPPEPEVGCRVSSRTEVCRKHASWGPLGHAEDLREHLGAGPKEGTLRFRGRCCESIATTGKGLAMESLRFVQASGSDRGRDG